MSLVHDLLQTMPQAVFCCDGHGVIQASSAATLKLLQQPVSSLHSKPLLELIHPDDRSTVNEALVSLQQQNITTPFDKVRFAIGNMVARGDVNASDDMGDTDASSNTDASGASGASADMGVARLSTYVSLRGHFTKGTSSEGSAGNVLLWLEPTTSHQPSRESAIFVPPLPHNPTTSLESQPQTSYAPVAVKETELTPTSPDFCLDDRPTALYVLDAHWHITYANELAAQWLHASVDALLGQNVWQLASNLLHNQFGAIFRQAMKTGQPLYCEMLSDDEHLNVAWFGVHVLPVNDLLVIKVEDITERKYQQQQLEAAVNRSEQLFEQRNALLDAISDIVFIVDEHYRFVYVNQAGLELFDVTLENILGKPLWDVLHLPESSPFRKLYLDTMTTNAPQRIRALSLNPMLQGHTLDVKTTPFRGGFIAYSRDVTEFETLRAELVQTLTDKQAILDSITDGVTVLDREGVYLYANERVRRRNPDIIGKAYIELFPEHQVSIFETYYQRAFDSQEVVCFKAQTHRGHWLDVRVYPAGDRITVYATDFSEQKQLEQALRDSEAKFRTFFEKSNTPYTLTVHPSAERTYQYSYNQAFADLVKDTVFFEGDLSSLAGMHLAVQTVTHPEDFAEHKRQFAEVSAGKSDHIRLEKRYLNRDGSIIWVLLNVAFLHDDAGNITLSIATIQDITQRKHAEQARAASESKFRAFFHDSTVPHFMIGYTDDTRANIYLETNATFDALFAGTVLAGAPRIMPTAQYRTLSAALSDAYVGEPFSTSPQEKWYRNQDGSTFCCQVSSVSFRDDQSNRSSQEVVCLSTLQDITKQKRAQQALEVSEAKFRAFFENNNIPCAMFIFDDGDEWERGFHFNDAFANFLKDTAFAEHSDRLSSVENTLQALTAIAHPEDNAEDERCVAEVIAGERNDYHFEKRYFTRDGDVIWGDVNSMFLRDDQGELTLGMSIIQDITKRKRAQAALEKALADKDLLLKEVHHRTKNNMQLISSMLAIQSRRIVDDPAKQALVDSSKRINLLASVHRALYQTPNSGDIDAGEQLHLVLNGLTQSLRDVPIIIRNDITRVLLDVHQAIPLSLVANELLTNAFKHAFPEPKIGDTLRVRLLLEGDQVTFEVRDNGVGIPEDIAVHDSLGMVIITTLTDQLNASLTLEQLPEGGTVARVTFVKHVLPL